MDSNARLRPAATISPVGATTTAPTGLLQAWNAPHPNSKARCQARTGSGQMTTMAHSGDAHPVHYGRFTRLKTIPAGPPLSRLAEHLLADRSQTLPGFAAAALRGASRRSFTSGLPRHVLRSTDHPDQPEGDEADGPDDEHETGSET